MNAGRESSTDRQTPRRREKSALPQTRRWPRTTARQAGQPPLARAALHPRAEPPPRQRARPSELPPPAASARETVRSAASAANPKPAAKSAATGKEPPQESMPAISRCAGGAYGSPPLHSGGLGVFLAPASHAS